MKIAFLSLTAVLVDDKSVGSITDLILTRPESAAEILKALVEREDALRADLAGLTETKLQQTLAQLVTAEAEVERLKVYAPPPPPPPQPKWFLVVELPEPSAGGTHAGILQPPAIGGDWTFDLLLAVADTVDEYTIVKAGLAAPASEKVTSLSELTAEQATQDIVAALAVSRT